LRINEAARIAMRPGPFDKAELQQYERDGYILVPGLFAQDEIDRLGSAARQDRALDQHAMNSRDGEGGTVRLAVWNQPGDGIYGLFARCHRVVDRVEQLLDDEAYHYHSKMIMKDAKTGGAWAWHQDYGYWYHNAVLSPDLCSVFVAVDAATKVNGCLQVLRGSHKLGRIDHALTGDQAGADPERVAIAAERCELAYCEMQPGDALFFHANLLHRSDQNQSDDPRWTMVCCYNARSNDPYQASRHPRYTPLIKVDDVQLKNTEPHRQTDSLTFLDKTNSTAARIASESERLNG
jgi:hypothetical protein